MLGEHSVPGDGGLRREAFSLRTSVFPRLCFRKSGAGLGQRAFAPLQHLGRSHTVGSSRVFGLKVRNLTRSLPQELTPNSS